MTAIRTLNHAVLFVTDARRSAEFYSEALGMEVAEEAMGGRAVFMRSPRSGNHHDLGLFTAAPDARPAPRTGHGIGLYHLAWQVDSVGELAEVYGRLQRLGAYVGENDHGPSLSVYAKDPDGIEFEVMFLVPAAEWDTRQGGRLDLDAALAKYGA